MAIEELAAAGGETYGPEFWGRLYDATATMFGADPFPFLNLGFAEPDSDRIYDRAPGLRFLQGSPYYDALRDGTFAYWRWTARARG